MPIEREPKSPLAKDFKPEGGVAYHVQDGDTWGSVAAAHGIRDAWTLIQYNFKSRSPAEINYYLKRNVGCVQATADGKNWMFSSGASPGTIYLPPAHSRQPAGTGEYIVREGETFKGIAYAHGHKWETLWEHEGNRELKNVRKETGQVRPGDKVHIPAPQPKTVEGGAETRHRFKRVGKPDRLGTLALHLEIGEGEASHLGDVFTLKGEGGSEPYEVAQTLRDDADPGAHGVTLLFTGLPIDASYTLKVTPEDESEQVIFESVPFAELHKESDRLQGEAVQPE